MALELKDEATQSSNPNPTGYRVVAVFAMTAPSFNPFIEIVTPSTDKKVAGLGFTGICFTSALIMIGFGIVAWMGAKKATEGLAAAE